MRAAPPGAPLLALAMAAARERALLAVLRRCWKCRQQERLLALAIRAPAAVRVLAPVMAVRAMVERRLMCLNG